MTDVQIESVLMPFLVIMAVFLIIWSTALSVGLWLSVRNDWRHRNDD